MTLEELRIAKAQLEEKLLQDMSASLREFAKATGCAVTNIHARTSTFASYDHRGAVTELTSVSVDIDLGF